MKKLSIYVTCALKHASEDFKKMIAEFKRRLAQETGHTILEFVTNPDEKTATEIYQNDIPGCVMTCDLIIADLTLPSTGEGYEMGTMKEARMGHIIGIAQKGTDISKLILGIPNLKVSYYEDLDEMVKMSKERIEDFILNQGKLIVVGGPDGSGKATQVRELVACLVAEGRSVKTLDFPQYENNHFGKLIGECLAGKHGDFTALDPKIASVLYAADRFESSRKIKEWLDAGDIVVLDRYVSANQLHQGGKIHDDTVREDFLAWLDHMEHEIFKIPRPDIIIFLDVPVEISQKLMLEKKSLDKKQYNSGSDVSLDQHENDPEHLRNAKESGLKMIAAKATWKRVECYQNGKMLPIPVVHDMVRKTITDVVPLVNNQRALTELGSSERNFRAPQGKFRATVMIDSCVYQIGNDVDTPDDAFELCSRFQGMDHGTQIFDDQGQTLITNGKLATV